MLSLKKDNGLLGTVSTIIATKFPDSLLENLHVIDWSSGVVTRNDTVERTLGMGWIGRECELANVRKIVGTLDKVYGNVFIGIDEILSEHELLMTKLALPVSLDTETAKVLVFALMWEAVTQLGVSVETVDLSADLTQIESRTTIATVQHALLRMIVT